MTSRYFVKLGDYKINENDGQKTYEIEKIILHPDYKPPGVYDVALVKLTSTATFDAVTGQICLPRPGGKTLFGKTKQTQL